MTVKNESMEPQKDKTLALKRIAILAYPNLTTFEFACAVEIFALERVEIKPLYETDIVQIRSGLLPASGNFYIQTDTVFKATKYNDYFNNYDRVVIAGWRNNDNKMPDDLLLALRNFYNNGGELVSLCSGSFAIAETGLLDGKMATTHWLFEESFKQKFPKVHFQENVLYTDDDRIYTSAGSAAGLDLGLHIIRKDHGASVANQVAKRLVISPHREGGQAQYANHMIQPQKVTALSKCLDWVIDNLDREISINQMAEKACLSRRSFDRHFRDNLGQSPKAWLIKQRVNLARDFLENSDTSIETIAEKTGFNSTMNLRHHFAKILGVSPTYYRNQFLQA